MERFYGSVKNKVFNVKKEKAFGASFVSTFLNSCFGKFIFFISHLCGYSAALENLYGLTTAVLNVSTNRTISGNTDLPNRVLCHDSKAVNCDNMTQMPLSKMPQAGIATQQIAINNMYQNAAMGQPGIQMQPGMMPMQQQPGMMPMQPQPGMQMNQVPMQIQPQPGMPGQGMMPMQPTQYQANQPMPPMQPMAPMPQLPQNQQDFVIPNNNNDDNPYKSC